MSDDTSTLLRSPMHQFNEECDAKFVPFAGYEMPLHYEKGILAEHLHTRKLVGLFDVSHMGQIWVRGENAAAALETLVVGDIQGLAEGQTRYTLLTNESGGIIDDLMVTRHPDGLLLVVNAARKQVDFDHLSANLAGCGVEWFENRALVAVQGPMAVSVMARYSPGIEELPFMHSREIKFCGVPNVIVTRSGYTGEDGYELSIPGGEGMFVGSLLLMQSEVKPAGLGARDSLRLEAGLCLYGHDIDETTTPVEAGLTWTIGKRRKMERGFLGADAILAQLDNGPARRRVGIRPDGKAPAREGTVITTTGGEEIGVITSGGFGPSVDGPVAMGYVRADHATDGTALNLNVRGKDLPAHVAPLPFVPHRYFKKG